MNSVVIATPTYNEAGNIEALLRRILAQPVSADIWVIDDGSADGTGEIVERVANEFPNVSLIQRGSKQGIGSAHLLALKRAKSAGYAQLVTLDADFSHQPEDIPRLLAATGRYAVVLGTRFADSESLSEWTAARKVITHLGHFLTKRLLRIPYDASGGLRVYDLARISDEILQAINARDYEFFFESITIIDLNGLPIGEIPVKLPARAYGHSKMRLSHAIKGLWKLLQLSIRMRQLKRRQTGLLPQEAE